MGSILLFIAALLMFAAWWLLRQGVLSKPWLEQGAAADLLPPRSLPSSAAKAGLGVLLAVIGSLFALFISAYAMRMQMSDWRAVPVPNVVWLNTGMLVLSSIVLQGARNASWKGDEDAVEIGLFAAGVTALAFLSGQLLAWRQLTADGYLLTSNSANAFFYVLTGIHGLHLLGGLVALSATIALTRRGAPPERLRLGVELCAIYWHFLLLVWLVLLSVLTGWAGDLIAICRQALT